MEQHHHRYVDSLISQIRKSDPEQEADPLDTLFLGGGTPTVLGTESLAEIIAACKEVHTFATDIEVSIEANPETIDVTRLKNLRKAGVNRISIGVQSFNDDDLLMLGRIHGKERSIASVFDAQDVGFTNISLDLMYGLPGQTVDSWQKNLEQAIALAPNHISAYQLTLEEGTSFFQQHESGSLVLPEEETILEMERNTRSFLRAHGYKHYEISNYAQAGAECRHNLRYWHNDDFIGRGAGAAGYYRGLRYKIVADPLRYCAAVERGESLLEAEEKLDADASCRETVVMGLRLIKGVDKRRLWTKYQRSLTDLYGTKVYELVAAGLLNEQNDYLRLTDRGLQIANQVMAELV